jgi:hypothetical protein
MNALLFVMAVLATYRASHLVVTENGPAYLFARLRQAAYDRFYEKRGHWIYEGIICMYCVSFWLAWVVALAIGAACILLHRFLY